MQSIEIILRDYDPKTDDPYIYSTWTRYCWYSPKEPHHIPESKKAAWFRGKTKEIKKVLETSKVKVACFRGMTYVIVGYIVSSGEDVIWTCVKKDYQGQGIESLLTKSIKEKKSEVTRDPRGNSDPSSAEGNSSEGHPSVEGRISDRNQ